MHRNGGSGCCRIYGDFQCMLPVDASSAGSVDLPPHALNALAFLVRRYASRWPLPGACCHRLHSPVHRCLPCSRLSPLIRLFNTATKLPTRFALYIIIWPYPTSMGLLVFALRTCYNTAPFSACTRRTLRTHARDLLPDTNLVTPQDSKAIRAVTDLYAHSTTFVRHTRLIVFTSTAHTHCAYSALMGTSPSLRYGLCATVTRSFFYCVAR